MKIIKVRVKIKESQSKINFWKAIWFIISNKRQTDGSLTSGLFGGIISLFFNIMAIMGAIISSCCFVGIIISIISFDWSLTNVIANIFAILIGVLITLTILCFSLLFRAAANEMEVEKDRNYIIAVFSAVVSFAALVVALIALLKGTPL